MGQLIDAKALFDSKRIERLLIEPAAECEAIVIDITEMLFSRQSNNWKFIMMRWMFDS